MNAVNLLSSSHLIVWVFYFIVMTLPSTVFASPEQDIDIDDELRRLEDELARPKRSETPITTPQPSAATTNMNPDISLIGTFALGWTSQTPRLSGGHDPAAMGYSLQGIELSLSSAVDPFFRFDSALLLSLYGIEIEEAYGTSLALPAFLQLRAGQFLTSFGRVNPTHLHQWNFATQPLIIGKFFGSEGLRGLGTELSQVLPIPWYAKWVLSIQTIGGAATGRSFLPDSSNIENLTDLTFAGRLEQYFSLAQNWEILFGLSSAIGPNKTGYKNYTDIYGADLLLKWDPSGANEFGWQSEALLRRRQIPGKIDQPNGDVLQDAGGYSELYWQWALPWQVAGRYEFVSGIDDDYLDPDWKSPAHRLALSMSYWPSHFSRVRLQYMADYNNFSQEVEFTHAIFLQLELIAGSHGAHTY